MPFAADFLYPLFRIDTLSYHSIPHGKKIFVDS